MKEYIDREAFIEDVETEIINLSMDGLKGTRRPHDELYEFIDRIKEQPVADVVEVVHGKWSWCTGDKYRCTNCGRHTHVDEVMEEPVYNFCPYCGAKMDLEK